MIDFGKLPFAILDGANDENNGEPQLVQNWLELPVNLNIMVVGATRSGIFPVECVVPVRSPSTVEPASLQTAISNLNISGEEAENKLLDDIRLYLGIMREGSYIVSDEMVKVGLSWPTFRCVKRAPNDISCVPQHIETDFVSTRSQQREQKQQVMSQQELIQLCAVARSVEPAAALFLF